MAEKPAQDEVPKAITLLKLPDGQVTVAKSSSPSLVRTCVSLCRYSSVRSWTSVMAILWLVAEMSCCALDEIMSLGKRQETLHTMLTCFSEFLSCIVFGLVSKKAGKLTCTIVLTAIVSFASLMSIAFVARECSENCETVQTVKTTFFYLTRLCIATYRNLIIVQTAECFPTAVRSAALGFCGVFYYLGSLLAMQLDVIHAVSGLHPLAVISLGSFVASILSCSMTEISNRPMEDYLEEDKQAMGETSTTT
mmetsp:Transcript_25766/g.45370  ORF Transcript_25766/g.45370 Transcript_25766/m.45370 type:complete len:251 (-) Transcript_25766:4069-4821(-)